MKKTIIGVIWLLLSVLLVFLLSNALIVSPLNQFNEDLESLQQKQKIYELDFEQVYLHDDYSIYPKDNLIAIKLEENDCGLILYYNQNKEYVDCEIIAPTYANDVIVIMLWFIVVMLSMCLAIGIILICVQIIDLYKKLKCRISVNKE